MNCLNPKNVFRIKKITIENFRGLKLPINLDFEKGGQKTSVLLYGRNGTGKSSIADAWEWFLKSEIKDLKKEGVTANDYPHRSCNGDGCYVQVDFSNPQNKFARITFNKARITAPVISGDYETLKSLAIYPNYLRYADLQEFVYFTKNEKYRYIAKYFGLDEFIKNQSDFSAALTKLQAQNENLTSQKTQISKRLKEILGQVPINEETVLQYINTIAAKHNIATITSLNQIHLVINTLSEIVRVNPVARLLVQWQAFKSKLGQFYPLRSLLAEAIELETLFGELKKDEASITQLFLSQLYTLTLETINKLKDKQICPVCDTRFRGNLVDHISAKHAALEELNRLKINFETKIRIFKSDTESIIRKTGIMNSGNEEPVKIAFPSFFENLSIALENLPNILSEIIKPLHELTGLSLSDNRSIGAIDDLNGAESQIKKSTDEIIKGLSDNATSKSLAADFSNVNALVTTYKEYLKVDGKKIYLDRIISNSGELQNHLTLHIQSTIQTTFSAIQTDVSDYYNILEESNTFLRNPVIKLVEGRDKSVELEIDFVSERTTPAYKFMSESQVNSFGLAIFMAATKFFNQELKFIILDDVVNSFDAYKRPKVAQMLARKFSDFQILLLTHDQIFSDTIQRDFPTWNRYKFTNWSFTAGPAFSLARNYVEEIESCLSEDNPINAGAALGRYLEWIFGVVNERLESQVKFKIDGIFTLAEMYDPLVTRLKSKIGKANFKHVLLQAFEEFEQGKIFRNYCSHWKNEANPFTTPEIESILRRWLEIESMLFCPSSTCKSFVKYEKLGNVEYVRCNCGSLNLKADTLYTPI